MAFADWVLLNYGPTASFVGGTDGQQVANAALGSPLTLQGSDCRQWLNYGPGGTSTAAQIWHVDTALYPEFDAIPDTKAIRVEAWVRWNGQTGSGANQEVMVRCKTGGATTISQGQRNGYSFGIRAVNPTYAFLTWRGGNIAGGAVEVNTGTQLAINTWLQIRMEVIPTLNGAVVDRDTIRCYINTGTEASPVWTLEYERVQLDTETAVWIPWGHATYGRVGFGIYTITGPVGQSVSVYIDSFDAKLKAR